MDEINISGKFGKIASRATDAENSLTSTATIKEESDYPVIQFQLAELMSKIIPEFVDTIAEMTEDDQFFSVIASDIVNTVRYLRVYTHLLSATFSHISVLNLFDD